MGAATVSKAWSDVDTAAAMGAGCEDGRSVDDLCASEYGNRARRGQAARISGPVCSAVCRCQRSAADMGTEQEDRWRPVFSLECRSAPEGEALADVTPYLRVLCFSSKLK